MRRIGAVAAVVAFALDTAASAAVRMPGSDVPAVQTAAWLGHPPTEHVKTYAHATLTGSPELDYPTMLGRVRAVRTPVIPAAA